MLATGDGKADKQQDERIFLWTVFSRFRRSRDYLDPQNQASVHFSQLSQHQMTFYSQILPHG